MHVSKKKKKQVSLGAWSVEFFSGSDGLCREYGNYLQPFKFKDNNTYNEYTIVQNTRH